MARKGSQCKWEKQSYSWGQRWYNWSGSERKRIVCMVETESAYKDVWRWRCFIPHTKIIHEGTAPSGGQAKKLACASRSKLSRARRKP